jgi:hypothetical protein
MNLLGCWLFNRYSKYLKLKHLWPNFQSGTTLRTRNFPSGCSTWWLSPAAGLFCVHLILGICEFAAAASCPPCSFMHEQYRIVIFVSLLSPCQVCEDDAGGNFWATFLATTAPALLIRVPDFSLSNKIRHQVFALVNNVQIRFDCFSSLICCCCCCWSFVFLLVLDL